MSHPLRGHVYWCRLPDEPGGKRRPVLVISPDVRNRLASDVIVVPLSSHLREAPTHVLLREGEAGLPHRSVVKCEQVGTILKERLVGSPLGGALSALRLREVERAVLRAIGVPID